jgi:hypothetical protein
MRIRDPGWKKFGFEMGKNFDLRWKTYGSGIWGWKKSDPG